MRNLLIQYLYLFAIVAIILLTILGSKKLFACEQEQVKPIDNKTIPVCEELQESTKEKPCKKSENINTVIKALEKLGESGTLPK